jgi:predicted esterase YcpF (UPF0227 family)
MLQLQKGACKGVGMIIYIHGFGGCGLGTKARLFRDYFSSRLIAPSLPYQPSLAIDSLKQIIQSIMPYEKVHLVGSSLGGFYSLYLANLFDLKYALINPALNPHETLQKYRGKMVSYYDESYFEWTSLHVKELQKIQAQTINQENCLLFLQKGDELLDFNEPLKILPNAKTILEEGGTHSFNGIERHFALIEGFFN